MESVSQGVHCDSHLMCPEAACVSPFASVWPFSCSLDPENSFVYLSFLVPAGFPSQRN